MPLIGLIDRKNRSWTWDQIRAGKGDFEDPAPMLLSLYYERDPYCDFSITELLNDPYFVQMRKRCEYYERPDDIGDRLLGIALHALMEKRADSIKSTNKLTRVLSETQLAITLKVGGRPYSIGGTCDLNVGDQSIWDYKTITIGKMARMAKGQAKDQIEDYKWQLNGYRWLKYEVDKVEIKKLTIRALTKDWRFYEFRKAGYDIERYPRGVQIPIPVVPLTEVKAHFSRLLARHVAAERVSDEQLHRVGECDTWGGIRCSWYCPLKSVCHFRNKKGSK